MGWMEGPWNTRSKAACPQPASARLVCATSPRYQQCSHDARRFRGALRYHRRVLSVALDWTGLGVVAGQRSACAYTPVNKLRGGKEPVVASMPTVADTCRMSRANAGERRRAVSCVAMPAPIPRRAAAAAARMHARGGRPRRSSAVAQGGENDRLVTGGHTTRSLGRWGLAIGLQLRQTGRWPRVCFAVR